MIVTNASINWLWCCVRVSLLNERTIHAGILGGNADTFVIKRNTKNSLSLIRLSRTIFPVCNNETDGQKAKGVL